MTDDEHSPSLDLEDEDETVATVQSPYGDTASEDETTQSTDANSTNSSQSDADENNDTQPPVQNTSTSARSLRVSDLNRYPDIVDPEFYSADDVVPGTNFELPYKYERSGKGVDWYRGDDFGGGQRRFDTLPETEELLTELTRHFDNEVYPDVKFSKKDLQEALLLAGMQNVEFAQKVLDAWGYRKQQDSHSQH